MVRIVAVALIIVCFACQDVGKEASSPHEMRLTIAMYGDNNDGSNGLAIDRNNAIYFTDPVYGLPEEEKDPTHEMNYEGIYRISDDGIAARAHFEKKEIKQ